MKDEKKTRFKWGIFQKMLIAMVVVALAPLGAIWYVNYHYSIADISSAIDQRLAGVSERLSSHLDDWIAMHLKALGQNAALADIQSMKTDRQNPILKTMLNEYKWSYLVLTTGPDGMNIGRSDDGKLVDYSDRKYYKDVMAGAPMGSLVTIGRTSGKPALILSAPIPSPSPAPRPLGVIAIAMNIAELADQIANLRIGKTGFAFLLDEGGFVVAHPNEEFVKARVDLSKHPAFVGRPKEGKRALTYEDGGRKVMAYVQHAAQGWSMVTQQDYDEAYAPIREANTRALILLGVTMLVVTLVAYLFSQRLANPIRNLTQIAAQISLGKMGMKIAEKDRGDEIGALARAIDRLATSVKLAMERLKAKG
jgi:methyl-accepting chemotaxis protein